MITRVGLTEYSLAMDEFFENQVIDREGSGNVYAGSGRNDTVVNYANGSMIVTGSGDDSITSVAGGVVIDSQDGDDSVIVVGAGTDINVGSGNDKTFVQGLNHKVDLGTGSDTVYAAGDGPVIKSANDNIADAYLTPSFAFQYIKNQGLIIDPLFQELIGGEVEEDEEEFDTVINIYE